MLPDHPHIETIQRYYHGCNTADAALITSTFTDDVVHYFTHHAPIRGAATLAGYWVKMQPRVHGKWVVDHALVQGDEAVIEWTMRWTPASQQKPQLVRGAEWYVFRNNLIAEIRAYYLNPRLPYMFTNFELEKFPYAKREYYTLNE
jgi:ketosteroid isomerase-like protein